ncbi:hypothetical protein GU3_05915 [Oceanimonas sp. GK1]|nr:hypothetical protein GU3_03250 [Oceanimonas sp. GK1]AEY00603.1 hypothetical protein GU3_04230 [Oceanimonas sp. GK1]AEY00939.1 hypothetical protein GU3_05915 [Oceanimonas sp. GK1]
MVTSVSQQALNLVLAAAEPGIPCFQPQLAITRHILLLPGSLEQEGFQSLSLDDTFSRSMLTCSPTIISRS